MGEWDNELEQDFKDPKFNSYLVEQPGANVELFDDCRRSKIIIKNVREPYSEKSIRNICREYGTVCSVQRGPSSNYYYFVVFGSPDEAQYAIEKINQLYKPMRAEFAKSREETLPKLDPMQLLLQSAAYDDCPINTNRIFKGPFMQGQLPFLFPKNETPLIEDEYKNSELGEIDEYLNFFNESAFCDFIKHPDDIKSLEENVSNYRLKDSIWVFKPDPKELELIKKKATNSLGEYDSIHEVHIKSHPDFKTLSKKIGKCQVCKKPTTRQTKKTSIFFCSTKCQDDNENINEEEETTKVESKKLPLIEFMDGINVVITSIINQNTVYVRPCDMRSTAAYYKQLQLINSLSQTATYLMKILPKPGDLVAVCIEEDTYMRAMVLKFIDREHIRVALLDTGAVSIQKLRNLRKLLPELRNLPIYVSKVKLKDVSNDYMSLQTICFLTKFVHSERQLEIKFDKEIDEVRLYDHNECLNNDLIELVNLGEAEDTDNDKDIYFSRIPTKTELELVIVDNSMLIHGQISCIQKNSVFKLEQIHSKVQCYGKKLKNIKMYTPRITELCIVFVGGLWYRGICEETVGDQHPTINCYDFGFWTLVNNKNIAPMPKCLLDVCYTSVFTIDGFEPENFKNLQMEAIRKELLPNKTIKVEKVIQQGEVHVIHSDEIREVISKIKDEIPINNPEVKPLNRIIANLSLNMSQNETAIDESNEDEVD